MISCHFEGKEPQEEVLAVFRHHWIFIFRDIFLFLLASAAYGWLCFSFPRFSGLADPVLLSLASTMSMIFYFHVFFLRIIGYFENIYIITNVRLVEIKEEDIDFFDYRSAPDIQKEQQWFLKVLLNFGKLNFSGMKVIECVPNPNRYYELFNKLKLTPAPMLSVPGQPMALNLSEIHAQNQKSSEPERIQEQTPSSDTPELLDSTLQSTLALNPPPKENERIHKTALPHVKQQDERRP